MDLVQLCEACEQAREIIIENCDDERDPYRVCDECHVRLKAFALRPREWYNLAKRHGWQQFLLHDDFYDDTGAAQQPEIGVIDAELHPSPTFEEVSTLPDALLDWTIVKWRFTPEIANAWKELPRKHALDVLGRRLSESTNEFISSRIIQVCGKAPLEDAIELLEEGWRRYPDGCSLWELSEASAACLPFEQGYDQVIRAVEDLKGARQRDAILVLAYFRSPSTLDWIEQHYFEPASENWGRLAILSSPSWDRLRKWIRGGRPLSLVALDAMRELLDRRVPIVREMRPTINDPPSVEEFQNVLTEYATRDTAPRVLKAVQNLIASAKQVIG